MPQVPNGFSVPMIKYPVLSELEILNEDAIGAYLDKYPDFAQESYFMTAQSLPGVLKFSPDINAKYWQNQNRPMPSFQVTEDTTGAGAGENVTVTLTNVSHIGATSSLSPVAVGQTWVDDATNIAYEVVAVDKDAAGAHTATLSPRKSTETAELVAAGSDGASFLKYYGRDSVNEASHFDDGVYQAPIQVEEELSIIRANKAYSDLAMMTLTEIGDQTYYVLDRGELDKDLIKSEELRLMFGQSYDNTKYENNRDTGAQGLLPRLEDAGRITTAPTPGTLDADFFANVARDVDANGLVNEYQVLTDVEFDIAWDAYMATFGANGGIIYASFGGNKEVAISRNFSSFSVNGVTYHRRRYAGLSSARTHGADAGTGYWTGTGIFIPQGELTIRGERQRYLNVFYMSTSKGGPIVFKTQDGGMVNPQGSTDMNARFSLTTYKGLGLTNTDAFFAARLG